MHMHQVFDRKGALVASGGWFCTFYLELALAKQLTRIGLRIPSCTLRLENHLATVRKSEAAIVSHCN